MTLTPEDRITEQAALDYVSQNRRKLARELTDPSMYPAEKRPVAVFMAGSPGAGKTEASQALIERVGGPVLRIDPDEYRVLVPGYNGKNSNLFQRGSARSSRKFWMKRSARGRASSLTAHCQTMKWRRKT